ncbi:anti-sigma factor [Stakelama sediminis]|uniref:Anti-sigma-K factor RskA n=1 Tax=Stakelama sediminis TaxID=463200 RepID=A0A840YWP3_9SPHN|nr:anti-sigma factor [Stakelama sediminis]MBB5718078.1 anti-sigma-K factor RskA [Stakelama sediminis]
MAEPEIPRDEWEALAAELALGLPEGETREQALQLQRNDPAFAAEVVAWEERFAPLFDEIAPVPAPPGHWQRIAAALHGAANDNDAQTLRQRLRWWQRGAITSAAVAAILLIFLTFTWQQPNRTIPAPRPASLVTVAQLTGSDNGPSFIARINRQTGGMVVDSQDVPREGLAPELWVIPADGTPHSLGLVARTGRMHMHVPVPMRAMLRDGATLAVTMEPAAGAPHAAPSSAPVASGKIATI